MRSEDLEIDRQLTTSQDHEILPVQKTGAMETHRAHIDI